MKTWLTPLVTLVLFTATTFTIPRKAQASTSAENEITSTASLPFSGSFYDSVTAEWVSVSGSIAVVTHVTGR
jgi:hypothetical protein